MYIWACSIGGISWIKLEDQYWLPVFLFQLIIIVIEKDTTYCHRRCESISAITTSLSRTETSLCFNKNMNKNKNCRILHLTNTSRSSKTYAASHCVKCYPYSGKYQLTHFLKNFVGNMRRRPPYHQIKHLASNYQIFVYRAFRTRHTMPEI